MPTLLSVSFFILIAYLVLQTFHIVRHSLKMKQLAKTTRAFSHNPKNASLRFLIIGDSTAFGTGALDPSNSIAGRLAQDFPQAQIENHSKNGLSTQGLLGRIVSLKQERFDRIFILIGGIDILSFVPKERIRKNLTQILRVAQSMTANRIILVSAMNIGAAPLFWFPLSTCYSMRTRAIRKIFMTVGRDYNVRYVDLYLPKSDDHFAKEPTRLYAADKIHPSDHGYGAWYEKIKQAL